MKTAKAAVFMGADKPFEVKEYPIIEAPSGMAGLSIIASGVCGTDIHIHRGKIPCGSPGIIGHEFVGRVEQISEADSAKCDIHIGDAAIVDIAVPCGECKLCKTGDDANCINMGVTNGGNPEVPPHMYGGYTEYNFSPVSSLIRIPEGLDPKMVCVFACAGPTALHAFGLADKADAGIEKADVAVVQGLGPVGMFAIMYFASLKIKHIIAVASKRNEEREQAARAFGATEVIYLADGVDAVKSRVMEASNSLGADVVYEASGAPQAVPQGMELLRNRGVYLIPGQYSNSGGVLIQPQMITFKALHIIGSSQYSVCDVKRYLDFLTKNPNLYDAILSVACCYKVQDINEAFEDTKARKNLKTMLV